MTQLNAFVGHSFAPEDRELIQAFLIFFNQVKAMDIGFSWESAEPAEPKELADKVKGLIQDKNIFIGICTTKEAVVAQEHVYKRWFNGKVVKVKEEHFSWKTSDWIIQEIGLAIGCDMELILLVESGLRQPGGLQGNLEYIPFDRRAPEKSFGKLLEMIQALRPKIKAVSVVQSETPAISQEQPRVEEKIDLDLQLEPKDDWTRRDYGLALFRAIVRDNSEREQLITAAYFATAEGQVPANHESWEARREHVRITYAGRGSLKALEELASKYPGNHEVQRYLALGYRHYEEHAKAGHCFMLAAEKTADEKSRLSMYGDAMVDFARAHSKEQTHGVLIKMRTLVPRVADGETILINALRQVKEVENNKELFCGLVERVLQLHPDDVGSRFTLAYTYSEADQDELSLYHYLKIPYQERTTMAWNNLGVQFDHFDLASNSVAAYKTAEGNGETLAMSNLARKLLRAGFLKEAQDVCDRALKTQDYHKNIGYTIQTIKGKPEEEESKQKEILNKAMPLSEFYRNYGRAAVKDDIGEQSSLWRGPDCELQITVKDGLFIAQGEYEKQQGLGLSLSFLGVPNPPTTPATDKYQVKYSGRVYGHTVKCEVTRKERRTPNLLPSLLSQMSDQTPVLMVLADDLSEIRVYEKRTSKEPLFYTLTRLS
jgi:tetratricopeptide (TPR) repeat protein